MLHTTGLIFFAGDITRAKKLYLPLGVESFYFGLGIYIETRDVCLLVVSAVGSVSAKSRT